MGGKNKVGRLLLSTICYIVARDKKHEPKVPWHTLVLKIQNFLRSSNDVG